MRAHRYKYDCIQDPTSWFILIIAAGQMGVTISENAVVTISWNAVATISQNAVATCDAMKDRVVVIVHRNVTGFAERRMPGLKSRE
jgi:hypothetical protein